MDRPLIQPAKPQGRTRIGTGKAILAKVDGRSTEGRRRKEITAQLTSDIGGDPSEAQVIAIGRIAAYTAWCEAVEAKWANGGELDIGAYATATNALRRYLDAIGFDRRPRDVTPDLRTYIATKRAAEPAEAPA